MQHPERTVLTTHSWKRRHDIDWGQYKTVVFESDDWGACEVARHQEDAMALGALWERVHGARGPINSTLETPDDLERLYDSLEQYRGVDGQHPVFTAFTSTGNPDFERIRENDFHDYADIGIDEGFPPSWRRGDLIAKWHNGMDRGVFAPEFHSNLHHTSPLLWLELLNEDSEEGRAARESFDRECYYQGKHLPEYTPMNVRQQHAWVESGVKRFVAAFGYQPAAAVTSDAYPVTEVVWALNGIRTVCLKNSRNNRGEIVVYHTKPWNNQNPYVPMGAYDPEIDVIYLGRNVYFESDSAQVAADAIRRCWADGEPAIVSTHRSVYVSLDQEHAVRGLQKLEALLDMLTAQDKVRFLTTQEVSDIYRRGWSLRRIGNNYMLRQYTGQVQEMLLPGTIQKITAVPVGISLSLMRHGDRTVVSLPTGDFLVEGDSM